MQWDLGSHIAGCTAHK